MKAFAKGLFLLLMVTSIMGCSRKKNNFLNRNWHAVTTEYNTLYNGDLALELGRRELNQNYQDNYWELLPVERMQVREEVVLPGSSKNPNFGIAEEKAIKAIQRHSMLIEGTEKNPQIDEAYLLLGKARYYDQRFVPALEAFNYVLHKYPLSNTITEARIWREKANIRLEFNELAIKNLKKILEQNKIGDQDIADASAMLAQAYINTSSRDSALTAIRRAARLTGDKEEKGRYLFIKGQLYNELGFRDSADLAFDEVIELNRKIPRVYLINAHIEKIKNYGPGDGSRADLLALLTDLEEDRENRPFLGMINFRLAEFHYMMDSTELAVQYYNRSLRASSKDHYLQSLNYQTLGNINFDAANFKKAGAYYDSTLTRLPKNSREHRLIRKKRDNLEDVIYYEDLARSNDSILYVASLPQEEQVAFYTRYVEELKEKVKAGAQPAVTAEEPVSYFDKKPTGMPGVPNPGNSFYFYNATAVAYGKQEFFRLWGNRELTDNWRSGGGNKALATADGSAGMEMTLNDPAFDPQTYISQIPTNPQLLDSLSRDRNLAWYNLGIIYREKFRENELAAEKLELLLENEPEERLILPAKYNLYKIYSETGDRAKAESVKNDILYQYPDSRYAAILENPGNSLKDEDDPTMMYQNLYSLYDQQKYEETIMGADELIEEFTGDELVPKLELLKAMATGRLLGYNAYKETLNYIALNYPQTEEGKKANQLLRETLPAMADNKFKADSTANSFKLVFPLKKEEYGQAVDLEQKIEEVIGDLGYSNFKVSLDVYDPEQVFVVVHGFEHAGRAQGFAELLSVNKKYLIKKNSFYISTPNYRIAQIHKNISSYLSTN